MQSKSWPTLPGPFDGAFSDFGGLNCVADLSALSPALSRLLRPGAPVLLCVMGPLVPWEWAWYLGHGSPAKAFRRLRRGGVAWRGLTVRYPSIGALRRAFAPAFRLRRVSAVGALLPPTYAEELDAAAPAPPRRAGPLGAPPRACVPPLPWLADHYLLELERAMTALAPAPLPTRALPRPSRGSTRSPACRSSSSSRTAAATAAA